MSAYLRLLVLLPCVLLATSCSPEVIPTSDAGDAGQQPDTGPMPSCEDGRHDADETDTDCGGPECPPCAAGSMCDGDGDCESLACTSGVCEAATCSDGVLNQDETSPDCGGTTCPECGDGLPCLIDGDCASGHCLDGACSA